MVVFLLSIGSSGGQEMQDAVPDQMATAAENVPLKSHGDFHRSDETTVHYENSNGFVPITPRTRIFEMNEKKIDSNNINVNQSILDEFIISRDQSSLIADASERFRNMQFPTSHPVYSTEARILLGLVKPGADRRSFDSEAVENDFELLKITNDTPTVANYHEFYNSLRNNQNEKSVPVDAHVPSLYEGRNFERERNFESKDGDRAMRIEDYMANYGANYEVQKRMNDRDREMYYTYSDLKRSEENNYGGVSKSKKVADNFPVEVINRYNKKESRTPQSALSVPIENNDHTYQPNVKLKSHKMEENVRIVASNHDRNSNHRTTSDFKYKPNLYQEGRNEESKSGRKSNVRSQAERNNSIQLDILKETPTNRYMHEALFGREDDSHDYENQEELGDTSDELFENSEITEKPRKIRKQRRRPSQSENSKRLPKEHRGIHEDIAEGEGRRKYKNQRSKPNSWTGEDSRRRPIDDDSEEQNYDTTAEGSSNSDVRKRKFHQGKSKLSNGWTNVSPNVEISHSGGIEIDQIEKPKLIVPVKVNLIPVANFDHATALGRSQGFDISNAVLQNYVTATPILSTGSTIFNPGQAVIGQNYEVQNVAKNHQNIQNQNFKLVTQVPDVIVGQSSFQSPVQAILVPQNDFQNQNKFVPNLRTQYQIHAKPLYAPVQNLSLSPNGIQQNLQTTNFQNNIPMGNPVYSSNQILNPNVQNSYINQVQQVPGNSHVIVAHPTSQTFQNFAQSTIQPSSNYDIHVNSNGLNGQQLINDQNVYVPQNIVASTTAPSPNYVANIDSHSSGDLEGKRSTSLGSNKQFVASASLAVGENVHDRFNNRNQAHGQNILQNEKPQLHETFHDAFRDDNLTPRTKVLVRNAQSSPTVLNVAPNFSGASVNNQNFPTSLPPYQYNAQNSNAIGQKYKDQNQQILKAANEIFENTLNQLKQLQKNQNPVLNKFTSQNSRDNAGSNSNVNVVNSFHSNSGKFPHLPNLGTRNVEIVNPNINFSPVDLTLTKPYDDVNNFVGDVFTTPVPIFTTTIFATSPKPVSLSTAESINVQSYVDSLTEVGAKGSQNLKSSLDLVPGRTLYNPINFVPNSDVVKNQKTLNGQLNLNEPSLQGLNLVPLIPGGDFYKNSYAAQSNLAAKPKLSSDLEKYAEEMFKESLKTIYSSQKWNKDRKVHFDLDQNDTPILPVGKTIYGSQDTRIMSPDIKQSKRVVEAHYTETDPNFIESLRTFGQSLSSVVPYKTPEVPSKVLEEILMTDFKSTQATSAQPVHVHHNRVNFNQESASKKYLRDYLTPPRPSPSMQKIPFDELAPRRKPAGSTFHGNNFDTMNNRPHTRPNIMNFLSKPGGIEASASSNQNLGVYFGNGHHDLSHNRPQFERGTNDFDSGTQGFHSESRENSYHRYPSLVTSTPIVDDHFKLPNDHGRPTSQTYDVNHQRTHNLMGLLRKNKQLPAGTSPTYFRDRDELKQHFEDENRQLRAQFYGGSLTNFKKKSDDSKDSDSNENSKSDR